MAGILLITVVLFLVFALYLVIGIPYRVRKLLLHHYRNDATAYHQILQTHFRYYNRLTPAEKERFVWRTFQFVNSKRFHYVGLKERDEMPVLVAATAVQLSFGWENFELSFFRDIYIFKNDYYLTQYKAPIQGHVNRHGIYLTWPHFVKGMNGMESNANLGLHEMAHAYTFVNFVTGCGVDKHFSKEFKRYMKVAKTIYLEMNAGRKTILGHYATLNMHEFWAVSVEVFFENPVLLYHELPELFQSLAKLLQQNPLNAIRKKTLSANYSSI
jgi:Mlc titration factor MtfA (ptsG expression regulator)